MDPLHGECAILGSRRRATTEGVDVIGRQVSHFYIIRILGSGGMGIVYEAQDTRLPRAVAVKFLKPGLVHDPEAISRFKREARLASSLNHQNICTILDVDETDDLSFIAMELLQGMSLKARLAAGPLSLDEITNIAAQVADALATAHEQGIMHRDITPGNIFLCESGLVKLLDFGLAKQLSRRDGEGDESDGLTTRGAVVGTIHYMAPEQLQTASAVDHRCDLFSLGAVLYQMATGARPFEAPASKDVLAMIQDESHVPVRQLTPAHPQELERIIDALLRKSPADRYQTAAALRDDIRRLRDEKPGLHKGVSNRREGIEPSVAVLPFEVVGAKEEDLEAFRDGLVEDLSSQLGGLDQVRVVPRASTRTVIGQTLREVGRHLHASFVLEGSVQRAGGHIRVIANLIEAESERAVLQPIVASGPADLTLAAQWDLAASIVGQLKPRLSRPSEQLPTRDPEAFHAFKRGQHQWVTSCYAGGWRLAIDHFQHAIARDPLFALAHVAIATAYNFLGYYCLIKPNLAFTVAAQSAERALSIDESFGPAYGELASVCFGRDWDWNGAEAQFRRALDLDPKNASVHTYYSWLLTLLGRVEGGLAEAQIGCSLEPSSLFVAVGRAHSLYIARRFDEAIEICMVALRAAPSYVFGLHVRGLCYLCKGMGPEAIADFEAVATLTKRTPFYLGLLGMCYGEFGRREQSLDLVAELTQMSRETYVHPQCYMLVYAGLRAQEKAEFQERVYEHGASPFNYLAPYFRELYNLDPHQPKRLEQMRLIA
jgi:TolB-like protein